MSFEPLCWMIRLEKAARFRIAITVLLTFALSGVFGQAKLTVSSGRIDFTSKAQLELIQASSTKISGQLIPATNQFAFLVQVQTFKGFNTELQRQHFNDNYLESDKFPTASFSGKIIEPVDFSVDGTYDVRAKGNLDIHGIKQNRIIRSKITIKNGVVSVDSEFTVPLVDHNISIPKIVNQKIATEIAVSFSAVLKQ